MKMLAWHATEFSYSVVPTKIVKKRFGDLLPKLESPAPSKKFGRSSVFFICSEKGDEKLELTRVRDEIKRSANLVGENKVILVPFAHLSNNTMEFKKARELIRNITTVVKLTTDLQVELVPFGPDKSLRLEVPPHHYNVAFRSIDPLPDGPNT
jgi:hypothetical protein